MRDVSRANLIVARHAPVEEQWRGRCYGVTDAGVSTPHREAASRVIDSLGAAPERVWSSQLERCRGLAAEVALRLGVPHGIDPRVAELDHGIFEGRAWDEIHRSEPEVLARWGERWLDEGPPGGESASALEARVRAWEAELDPAERHLLLAHAGVVRALRVIRAGTSWAEAMDTRVPHLEPHAS